MSKDSAPEKWEYEEHTRVKHELLRKYLRPWLIKLGSYRRRLFFFDGFAGRGEYIDKETGELLPLGSSVIALQVANSLLEEAERRERKPYFDKFTCIAIEKRKDHFQNLQAVVQRERRKLRFKDRLKTRLERGEFAALIGGILDELSGSFGPAFFFIDPHGYSGVPFDVIKRILSLPRTEVFLTFMTRDINRFLSKADVEKTLNELYCTREWREIAQTPDWRKRDQRLKDLYIKCLKEVAGVRYAFDFRVCMDEKYQTLYYLIHATNHFDGLKIMKDVMSKQGASGQFAYLGPQESTYKSQLRLFDDDLSSLKNYLLKQFGGTTKTFKEILEQTYAYTRFVESHYMDALRELEREGKIKIQGMGPRGGIKEATRITFLKGNLNPSLFVLPKTTPKLKIHYKQYHDLEGRNQLLPQRVNDGSIIVRFDKTSLPEKGTDIVCPHFLELKWAYGCPHDCAWCYLKGTFRFHPSKTSPVLKPLEKTALHTRAFLEQVKTPEILNTGEIADSLMFENSDIPFSKFIIPIFETQKLHKVLFLTKSPNVRNLLEIDPHDQAIISFSLNALPVAKKWEKAPRVLKRIEAARKVQEAGYEVRIRIDPMVPIGNWEKHYLQLLDIIFENLKPERITLGSLRGLQSTINGCTDRSWVKYLKETSNWGKKIDFQTRRAMYSNTLQQLREKYDYDQVALCKESIEIWDSLDMDYRKIRCNCVW